MNKIGLIFSLLACIIFSTSNLFAADRSNQSLDQIVAIVNDDVITRSELNHTIDIMKAQIEQANIPLPTIALLQKTALNQLINKKLQLQLAKQAHLQITAADLNKAIQHIAEQNHMSVNILYQHLHEEGMSPEEYRNEMRNQMMLQKLQQQEVVNQVSVTPAEVANFVRSRSWEKGEEKSYHLEDILIPFSDHPSDQEMNVAKKSAQSIMAQLKKGQSLSQLQSAYKGMSSNDLGWRKLTEIPAIFAAQVSAMQAKEFAGPFQAPNGYHIIQLMAIHVLNTQPTPTHKQIESPLTE